MKVKAVSPEAVHDVLLLVRTLDPALKGVSRAELQRLAFLGCLLSLFGQQLPAFWGYRFAQTDFGSPFSAAISEAVDDLLHAQSLQIYNGRLMLTAAGKDKCSTILQLGAMRMRTEFLSAAANSLLIVPPEMFSTGLENEPTTLATSIRSSGGALLEGPASAQLYDYFADLRAALPDSSELITAAVVWISFLSQQNVSVRVDE